MNITNGELNLEAKQRFYSSLSDIFIGDVGKRLEGNSGYINLMNMRNQYFKTIQPLIKDMIDTKIENAEDDERELYNKLHTFFSSYLNETGTPFYNKTQLHKNIYAKVYSNAEDTSLFWKTQKLYYVKTEKLFTSMSFDLEDIKFEFDASDIEHQKNNEKKEVQFLLVGAQQNYIRFKVIYKDGRYDRLKEYLNLSSADEVKDYIQDNSSSINHALIKINKNKINLEHFTAKTNFRKIVNVKNEDDIQKSVLVELGIERFEDVEKYLEKEKINIDIELIKKSIYIYKKQDEIDYFIHKDAEKFLREQFNLFLYDYLFNEKSLDSLWTKDRIETIQNTKSIAYSIIEYIGKFENELKNIWLKPRLVRKSNYVFTLDKIKDNIGLIEKIINSAGFEPQRKEYEELYKEQIDDEGKEIKREWKEFEFIECLNKDEIILEENNNKVLNDKYEHLYIDTKYFSDIKGEILDYFDDIDDKLDGILIKSENFQALNTILPKYKGQVDLIYIDPPFNTGSDFDYKDRYQDSTWLTIMENRLELMKEFLSLKGSSYLHFDENANYLGRIVTEKILGKENFKREVIWDIQVLSGFKTQAQNWILGHQSIYYFVKNDKYKIFNKLRQEHKQEYLDMFTGVEADGRRYLIAHGKKRYLDDVIKKGKPYGDVWADIMSFQQQPTAHERVDFDTQKPEKLLERIIKSSSEQDSVVMDFFGGSGTTIAVAHKLRKKWIGIEMGDHYYNVILPRMKKVLVGDTAGISKNEDVNWQGGGFFKYYELEQYEDILRKAKYKPDENNIADIFYNSEKLLDAIKVEDDKVKIDFSELYADIDIAETISNLTGKKIKKLNDKKVIFEDNSTVEFENMYWKDHKNLKPLIWWGDR